MLLGYGCRFLVHAMQHEHEHDHEREIKNSALLGWKKDLAVPSALLYRRQDYSRRLHDPTWRASSECARRRLFVFFF